MSVSRKTLLCLLFSFILSAASYAQMLNGYLLDPASVSSLGIGYQGTASPQADDAMTYNPANLMNTRNIDVNYFVMPDFFLQRRRPIISLSASIPAGSIGAFGIQYITFEMGDFEYKDENAVTHKLINKNKSIAVGYARSITGDLNAGLSLRYVHRSEFNKKAENIYLSLGFSYASEILDRKLRLGLSVTNLGNSVNYNSGSSMSSPSQILAGVNFSPLLNEYYSLSLQCEFSKLLEYRDSENTTSSFKALFTDWDDFPRDADVHLGLEWAWQPLELGNGFAYFQEFNIGNISQGILSNNILLNGFSHSLTAGIKKDRITISAGVSSLWHIGSMPDWELGYFGERDAFQFSVSVDPDIFTGRDNASQSHVSPLFKGILSAGTGYNMNIGKYHEQTLAQGFTQKSGNSINLQLESAFYMNPSNALIASVQYSLTPYKNLFTLYGFPGKTEVDISTVQVFSGYRYHPLKSWTPLYLQCGIGIAHSKVTNVPEYMDVKNKSPYFTSFSFGTGAVIHIYERFCITPSINYEVRLLREGNSEPFIGGFNKFIFGLGYGFSF
ncbi:MAG: PorV/PorQ family protein [Bacteroidota bacterium]